MTVEEFEEILERVSYTSGKRAVADALKEIGLEDAGAGTDIRSIRDFLKGFRFFKKESWNTVIKGTARVIGWTIVLGIGGVIYHFFPESHKNAKTAAEILQKAMEP